jgi:hypothetical protein
MLNGLATLIPHKEKTERKKIFHTSSRFLLLIPHDGKLKNSSKEIENS